MSKKYSIRIGSRQATLIQLPGSVELDLEPTMAENESPFKPLKKPKRRYSKGLKEIQILGIETSKASRDTSLAITKGFEQFVNRTESSADKKKDGALRDLPENMANGLSTTLDNLKDVPKDFTNRANKKRIKRITKVPIKSASRFIRIFLK